MLRNHKARDVIIWINKYDLNYVLVSNDTIIKNYSVTKPFLSCKRISYIGVEYNYFISQRDYLKSVNYCSFSNYIFALLVKKACDIYAS